MKLVVTGATGLVGTEVVRQALRNPAVTTVIALSRKPVPRPDNAGPNADTSKLQSVVLEDWASSYPESVKEQIRGADGCIWALAVTPARSKEMDFAEITRICSDYTINAVTNMTDCASKPFRFIYTSGMFTERDQSKTPPFMADYLLMRGRVENTLLDFAKQHSPDFQVTVSKPGAIDGPGRQAAMSAMMQTMTKQIGHGYKVHVSELAAAMIDQCLNGITKDPLWNDDLAGIGQRVLQKEDYLS